MKRRVLIKTMGVGPRGGEKIKGKNKMRSLLTCPLERKKNVVRMKRGEEAVAKVN